MAWGWCASLESQDAASASSILLPAASCANPRAVILPFAPSPDGCCWQGTAMNSGPHSVWLGCQYPACVPGVVHPGGCGDWKPLAVVQRVMPSQLSGQGHQCTRLRTAAAAVHAAHLTSNTGASGCWRDRKHTQVHAALYTYFGCCRGCQHCCDAQHCTGADCVPSTREEASDLV